MLSSLVLLTTPAYAQGKAKASTSAISNKTKTKATAKAKKNEKKPSSPKPARKPAPVTHSRTKNQAKPAMAAKQRRPKKAVEVDETIEAEDLEDETTDEQAESEDEGERDPERHAPPSRKSTAPGATSPWLEVGVNGGLVYRTFDYRERQSLGLRNFKLAGAPLFGAAIVLFPFSARSALSLLGVEAGYSRTFGVTSDFAGQSLDTSASAYRIELVLNFPLSPGSALRPKLGYRGRTLAVGKDVLPDLNEHGPRVGLEVRFTPASSFLVEVEAGAQYLLSGGELTSSTWFPSASGFAVDARLRGGLALAPPFQLLLEGGADYASFTFNADASNPPAVGVAAGAFDLAWSASLLARLLVR